jgi:hypothetical protein
MIVIAKKGTTKIVKGHRYEVQTLYNAQSRSNNNRFTMGRVYLKGIGSYVVSNFTDVNGNELPKIDWHSTIISEKRTEFEELKVNDILVCNSDKYTTLIKNSKYRIVDLKIITKQKIGYNSKPYTITDKKVKFEGCSRYFEYSSWKFRKLNTNESRELQLSTIFGDQESYSVNVTSRKIDIIGDKNSLLVKALAKSIIDVYRHDLDIIDWACQKSAFRLKITKDDYKDLLKMPLKDILNIVETNK